MSRESMGEAMARIVSDEEFAATVADNATALDEYDLDTDERDALSKDAATLGGEVSGFKKVMLESDPFLGTGFVMGAQAGMSLKGVGESKPLNPCKK